MSLASSSRRHVSPVVALEAPQVHVNAFVVNVYVHDVVSEAFGEGSYDTSLMSLYINHTARHVWDGEVKFICI